MILTTLAIVGMVTSVTDGDTLRIGEQRIRLAAIDAAENHGCRKGRVCAPGDGRQAKATLSRIAMGQRITCEPVGTSYNRTVAFCTIGGRDVSCSMLRARQAIYKPGYDKKGRLRGCTT